MINIFKVYGTVLAACKPDLRSIVPKAIGVVAVAAGIGLGIAHALYRKQDPCKVRQTGRNALAPMHSEHSNHRCSGPGKGAKTSAAGTLPKNPDGSCRLASHHAASPVPTSQAPHDACTFPRVRPAVSPVIHDVPEKVISVSPIPLMSSSLGYAGLDLETNFYDRLTYLKEKGIIIDEQDIDALIRAFKVHDALEKEAGKTTFVLSDKLSVSVSAFASAIRGATALEADGWEEVTRIPTFFISEELPLLVSLRVATILQGDSLLSLFLPLGYHGAGPPLLFIATRYAMHIFDGKQLRAMLFHKREEETLCLRIPIG